MLFENMIIGGTYRIISEIGSGGMGVVFLAYHLRLQKNVVLKQIKNPYADISMLRNEVDMLKGLHHPYLPQVYDFVEHDGYIYTVIDYIDGCDFNYYIENGWQFTESQLIKWLRQLCEVLAYLHSRNPQILHSDIKPGNIIVTASGDICLIDFGISVYNTDVLKGLSENYSSPEQYGNFYYLQYGEGSYVPLDERTDLYSLGATFYHIMTGVRPDVRNFDQVPINGFALPYSDALIGIIQRMMMPDRNKRFRNASEILKAIDNIKKQDIRYKKFILLQVATSVSAAIMIVLGIFLVVNGYQQQVRDDFAGDYNAFITASDTGKSSEAAPLGMDLLNKSEYNSLLSDSQKAQISHKIGDSFYGEKDYYNAAHYYRQAIAFEQNELYSRDLIIALLQDGREDEAAAEMENVNALYPSSAVIVVADAQLSFERGEYLRAIETIDSRYADFADDNENRYMLGVIKGDALAELGRYSEAANEYGNARNNKETVSVIRKQGDAYVKSAMKSGDRVEFRNAFSCYETLRSQYSLTVDDAINYAQSALSLEDVSTYEECKKNLLELAQLQEDFRLYIVLAELAEATGDPQVAGYCEKAHSLYRDLPDEEKDYVLPQSLSEIKRIYSEYCGGEW